MNIGIIKIPPEGLTLQEDIAASALDLDTEIIKCSGPVRVNATVTKITNAVSVELALEALLETSCSRCLNDFKIDLKKNFKLNYPISKTDRVIDLDKDIREEIILDYFLKPLCSPDCKGLCPCCGKNLNEGGCGCGST